MSDHSSQEITAVSDERQSSHRALLRKMITKIAKGELKELKVHGWLRRLPSMLPRVLTQIRGRLRTSGTLAEQMGVETARQCFLSLGFP